jgi:hypothetical protein
MKVQHDLCNESWIKNICLDNGLFLDHLQQSSIVWSLVHDVNLEPNAVETIT